MLSLWSRTGPRHATGSTACLRCCRASRFDTRPRSDQWSARGCHDASRNVSVLFTHVRSLIKKRDESCSTIDTCDAGIVASTETWLLAKIRDTELFLGQKHFNTYRHDREKRSDGGVLIGVRDCISSFLVDINGPLEVLFVCVEHPRLILGCCYLHAQLTLLINWTMH